MRQELKAREEDRRPPSTWARVRDTAIGVAIMGVCAFLKWKVGFGDAYFTILMLLGATFVSKSLAIDFIGAAIDKIRK